MSARDAPADGGRRRFVKVTALGAFGFVLGCGESEAALKPPRRKRARTTTFDAFVRIGSDDTVTVVIKHLDKGQGVTTGLTTIVAEELDAAWPQMRWEFAPADAGRYNNLFFGKVQGTGGSTSIANSWQQLRAAGAAARAMLVAAAAERWNVPAAEITVAEGIVRHASGKRATFGELAPAAGRIAPPQTPALKDPAAFKLIGAHLPRIDTPEKTSGRALYTLDFVRPGMLTAVLLRPPRFGASLKSFEAGAALAQPGVVECFAVPRGIAIVAKSMWSALEGRKRVTAEWDEHGAEMRGTPELFAAFKRLAETPGIVARREGVGEAALDRAAKVLRAEFEFPYLAHAPMEPLNAVVELHADGAEIWAGSQAQTLDQGAVAKLTGLEPARVGIHTLFAGGSFGRRGVPDSDYIVEAVTIAKALKTPAPLKLQWTREDDLRGGRYRPMSVHSLAAALDARGRLTGWTHRIVVQSFIKGLPVEGIMKDGID
ncbi:MAG: xanthine dehydrogenase family protein molybdopterin-binding subunit, partial [Gammaproteobacteria bacterium]|nr:xanthine dehydrogenase family protein molybdopterin-binding subunit [Gammaproteobacteria bacterium]